MSKDVEIVTKAQLVEDIANDCEESKAKVGKILDSFCENIADNLAKGKTVALTGWGSWSIAEKKARKGFNPQTKKPITIPASKKPKFKMGSKWKNPVKKQCCKKCK